MDIREGPWSRASPQEEKAEAAGADPALRKQTPQGRASYKWGPPALSLQAPLAHSRAEAL